MIHHALGVYLALGFCNLVPAQEVKLPAAEPETEVLVLATPHLRQLDSAFRPGILDRLVASLAAFEPVVIAVEGLPPRTLTAMRARSEVFAPVLEQFAGERVEIADRALGSRSREEVRSVVESAMGTGKTGARSTLVVDLLATYDNLSAVLHWGSMSVEARREELPEWVDSYLGELAESSNESVSIGVRLARRLGLSRIDYIDDHMDKDDFLAMAPELMRELEGNEVLSSVQQASLYGDLASRLREAARAGDLQQVYEFVNSADYGQSDMDLQWGVFTRTKLDSRLDRARIALWEVRNLNMVSNIRRATVRHAGERVLVIVGAGHKPFFDLYLDHLIGVSVVQLADVIAR